MRRPTQDNTEYTELFFAVYAVASAAKWME